MYLKDKPIKLFRDKGEKYRPVSLYLGNKKIAGYEYSEVTGESLSVSDTYNSDCSITINGKSNQTVTVQGKNLFDKDGANNQTGKAVNAVDGTVSTNVLYLASDYLRISPNTTYHAENCNKAMAVYDINKVFCGVVHSTTGTDLSFKFTSLSNAVYVRLSVQIVNKDIAQLEKGSVATTYEPFVPNSPSPDYPSPINSANNFDLVSSGKNLFDKSNVANMALGEGAVIIEGNTLYRGYYVPCKPNMVYSAKRITPTTNRFAMTFTKSLPKNNVPHFNPNPATVGTNQTNQDVTISSTSPSGAKYVFVCFSNQGEIIPDTMLCEGAIQPYEPFRGLSIVNFPYTLGSLPDGTKDYDVTDAIAKTRKLYGNVGYKVFDGTEKFALYRNTDAFANNYAFSIAGFGVLDGKGIHIISTHFLPINLQSSTYVLDITGFSQWDVSGVVTNLYLKIPKTMLTSHSVVELKAWLATQYAAGTPVKIQYKLANSQITTLPYTAVKQYYPQTQIYSNATVQPTLSGNFRIFSN